MPTHETVELGNRTNIVLFKPLGLGFGDGPISVEKLKLEGLSDKTFEDGKEIILNDDRVWSIVEVDDDGCGDGRKTSVVYTMLPQVADTSESELRPKVFDKSKNRAKVFGGGLIVASSMLRAVVWGEPRSDDAILQDREKTIGILSGLSIRFGAHTDNHRHGDNCGCGAIDKYPVTIKKTIKYRKEITDIIKNYVGEVSWNDEWDQDVELVFSSYENQLNASETFFANASGSETMSLIERSGAIIKELVDDHQEAYVVLNDVDGTTFNQRQFEAILREKSSNFSPQIFAVDLWRGRMYAKTIADYAEQELGLDQSVTYRRNLIDFLARSTSGPAATLTDGTQPVFLRLAS